MQMPTFQQLGDFDKYAEYALYNVEDTIKNICPFIGIKNDHVEVFFLDEKNDINDATSQILIPKKDLVNVIENGLEILVPSNNTYATPEVCLNHIISEYKIKLEREILTKLFALKTPHPQFSMYKETPKKGIWNWLKKFFSKKVVKTEDYYQNSHILSRKILVKLLAASNKIASVGRRGPANALICNCQFAAFLQDCASFLPDSTMTTNLNPGGLYRIGHLVGITILVDPYMRWNDTRVLLGHFNTKDDCSGIKLFYKEQATKYSSLESPQGNTTHLRTTNKIYFPAKFVDQLEMCEFNIDLI